MASQRDSEYKPLLFTTTVRNPQRLKGLLWVLKKYDGQVLTDNLATAIVGETIRYGLYRPMKKSPSIKNKWANTPMGEFANRLLTNEEVRYMLDNNPQKHKEAGFAWGFPSRFATIFDFAKELGFVYFQPNKKIEFSELGNKIASVFCVQELGDEKSGAVIIVEEEHPEYEQQAFLQSMCKYQRSNPFVRVLNDNVPLLLLLEVLKKINANPDWNGKGITRKELPLLIFWKDNDAEALYQRIIQLREQYRYNPSDEVVVDICVNEIMEGKMKKFDSRSIINDYPDEFIRKMRLTGLISLRGSGRFIDINHNEDERVEYVLSKYSKYEKYCTEREYFDYMATIDENLFSIESIKVSATQTEELLIGWTKEYSWDSIKFELETLSNRRDSKDDILRFLPSPVRLEFLTALAIKSKMPNVRVLPNYSCDDTGLPTSTAGGGIGDIECIEQPNGILVEVTMAEGRQQTMMEIWPIERHLVAFKEKYTPNSQCIFVAPSIFSDSIRQIEWVKGMNGHTIRPYKISDFICYLETETKLYAI